MATFRLAMGVTFLSPVADRFGLWGPPGTPNVSWGNWDRFVAYSTRLNWYLPDALQQSMAALAMATGLGIRAPPRWITRCSSMQPGRGSSRRQAPAIVVWLSGSSQDLLPQTRELTK